MIDNNTNNTSENPPAYPDANVRGKDVDVKKPLTDTQPHLISGPLLNLLPYSHASSSTTTTAVAYQGATTAGTTLGSQSLQIYTYKNPATQQIVHSLLPPDHPEMVCLQAGEHVQKTTYGLLGWLVAIAWFPLGVGLCLAFDRKVKCARCGQLIKNSWGSEVCS